MGVISKLFGLKKCSDIEIKQALENVSNAIHKYCESDAKSILAKLEEYDSQEGLETKINIEELLTFLIYSNEMALLTAKLSINPDYLLTLTVKTILLFKRNSFLKKDLFNDVPIDRFKDGYSKHVHRADGYLNILQKTKPWEMGTAMVTKAALKYIYGDDEAVDLDRAKILAEPMKNNYRDRYLDIPLIHCLT